MVVMFDERTLYKESRVIGFPCAKRITDFDTWFHQTSLMVRQAFINTVLLDDGLDQDDVNRSESILHQSLPWYHELKTVTRRRIKVNDPNPLHQYTFVNGIN